MLLGRAGTASKIPPAVGKVPPGYTARPVTQTDQRDAPAHVTLIHTKPKKRKRKGSMDYYHVCLPEQHCSPALLGCCLQRIKSLGFFLCLCTSNLGFCFNKLLCLNLLVFHHMFSLDPVQLRSDRAAWWTFTIQILGLPGKVLVMKGGQQGSPMSSRANASSGSRTDLPLVNVEARREGGNA